VILLTWFYGAEMLCLKPSPPLFVWLVAGKQLFRETLGLNL
jgi:hypothetical protein